MQHLQRPLPVVGVVHLAPLPGSPRRPGGFQAALDRARTDAIHYVRAGVDALLIENHGDAPFDKDEVAPHVPAMLAVVARELAAECRRPVGINVLRNDVVSALGAAAASEASFVRANVLFGATATDQGIVEGKAAEALRYRLRLGVATEIWADVDVKFGTALYAPGFEGAVRAAARRSGADRLLVTGEATGVAPSVERVRRAKAAAGDVPVLVASGVTRENLAELLPCCDGVVVGSAFKEDDDPDRPVDPARVSPFMNDVRALRRARGLPA